MRTSYNILEELLQMTGDYVGRTFTEEMRRHIYHEAASVMESAFDEGQAMTAPRVCINRGKPSCRLLVADEDAFVPESEMCLDCIILDGGFDF